jgi:exopolysaccharide biosynthesis polyprenyl glycosylphosphotransferase
MLEQLSQQGQQAGGQANGVRSRTRSHASMSRRIRLALLVADIVFINLAFVVSYFMRYQWQWFRRIEFNAPFTDYAPMQALFILTLLAFFWLDGVYAPRRAASWFDQVWTIVGSVVKAVFIVWSVIFIYGPAVYSRLMIAEAGVLVIVLLAASRALRNGYEARLRARGVGVANVVIVGAGELGRAVMRTLFARPELGYRCIGFLDDHPQRGHTAIGRFPALGEVNALPDVLGKHSVDEVVITLPWSAQPKITELIDLCQDHGVRARIVPSLLQMNLSRIDVNDFGGIPMLTPQERMISPFNRAIKRAFDLLFGAIFLLLSLPIIGLAAICIRLESPGSAIFSQMRAGQNGKPFKVYKLRSMHKDAEQERENLVEMNEADGPMFKIKHDPRQTRVGRVIRKLSIDELPQFWNVIIGSMSVVGPRPALMSEVAQYYDWHRERLRMKPGVTGLWQISGRSELMFDEMCLLDVYYIENWSIGLDFKIMLKTVPYLLSGKGAY